MTALQNWNWLKSLKNWPINSKFGGQVMFQCSVLHFYTLELKIDCSSKKIDVKTQNFLKKSQKILPFFCYFFLVYSFLSEKLSFNWKKSKFKTTKCEFQFNNLRIIFTQLLISNIKIDFLLLFWFQNF